MIITYTNDKGSKYTFDFENPLNKDKIEDVKNYRNEREDKYPYRAIIKVCPPRLYESTKVSGTGASKEKVVVKEIYNELYQREINALKLLKHKNIIKLIDTFSYQREQAIIYEY